MDYDKMYSFQDTRILQSRNASIDVFPVGEDEPTAEADEPPDDRRHTLASFPDFSSSLFHKSTPPPCPRSASMLTSMIIESERESHEEMDVVRNPPERGMSTCSNASVASTADLTSDGFTSPTRTNTPSPPLPPTVLHALPTAFAAKPLGPRVAFRQDEHEAVAPVVQVSASVPHGSSVEAGLGRKRCIKFACGPKEPSKPETTAPPKAPEEAEPPKRRCLIKWACPPKLDGEKTPGDERKASVPRRPASPAPNTRREAPPRHHRDSDSTVRNDSGRTLRKSSSVSSIINTKTMTKFPEFVPTDPLKFHEFAGSDVEDDEWTKESTCHRSRLTIDDTLKVENRLRKLGEEAEEEEEEAMEDEEALDNEIDEDDEGGANEEDDETLESVKDEVESDDGFQTDDEDGFAGSDDDNDSEAGSDYRWWEPGRSSTAATSHTSMEQLDIIRPRSYRSMSQSSAGSASGPHSSSLLNHNGKRFKKPRPLDIHPNASDLPDSTDFVCGTLDEDRPLEEAYLSHLERRRAAKHRVTPQDFDPTFPRSDPEMDEEDNDDEDEVAASDSDQHLFLHGSMEQEPDSLGPMDRRSSSPRRGMRSPIPPILRSGRRSPPPRLRSPPPPHHRSPPPRRLFATSPRRLRSPPPVARLRSPPPTRRSSAAPAHPLQLAERPKVGYAGSLPRAPTRMNPGFAARVRDDDDDDATPNPLRVRGAIDIVKGLEKKRQLRKQKLYQKNCTKQALHPKDKQKSNLAPGKGAEKMRLIGMECAAHKAQQKLHLKKPAEKDMYMASL